MRFNIFLTRFIQSLKFYFRLRLVFGIAAIIAANSLRGQEAPGQDIKKIRNLARAISDSETLLSKYPNNEFTPNLMFQLSELYVKRAALRFQREMMMYEESLEKYDRGLIIDEPTIPRINLSDAIEMCYKILDKYPNSSFRDKVLYRIALCHFEEGNKEKAAEYFQKVVLETDEKQFLEEANFRLGEYYFDLKVYEKAIDYYSHLLNSWDSPFFDMALYKLGWSHYNLDHYSQAISTFIYLIEDINLLEQVDSEFLGKTKADLRRESIEYIAICFTEFGGAKKARDFLKERKDKDYTIQILMDLVDKYQARNFYADAIETIRVLIDFYPDNPQAPKFQQKIVENYELAGDQKKANQARARLIAKYGPDSRWLKQMPEGELRQEILDIVEESLYTLGTGAQAKAQETKLKLEYQLAINRYRTYLEKFPNSERRENILFYLAECLYEIDKFNDAADSYYELLMEYPNSEFRELAAYNRILAYNQILQQNSISDSTILELSNFLGKGKTKVDTINVINPYQAYLIQASNDFYLYFPNSQKLPEVLMKLAEIFFELGEYSLAKTTYQQVINGLSTNGYLPQAYTMIAQCAFNQGYYEEAEQWFNKLSQLFPDSARYVEKANKMIASTRFKVAELFIEKGDSSRAAAEFEKVSFIAPDSAVAERALFEAALQYENIGNKEKALTIYESLPFRFPKSNFIDKSLFKAGLLCEELEDWNRAATNYLAIYQHDAGSQFASKGLFFAAKCYENFGDFDKAKTYFDEYTKMYYHDPDRYLEAAFRNGEIAYNQKQYQTALKDFEFVVSSYQNFIEQNAKVENYIPANAQFLIGEILFDSFQKIKLIPPFERKLKYKKAEFEKVLKSYTEAAKYKVADWSTASSYKIGCTFEEFANALLESPRPKNLSDSALEEYNAKLWQTVLPFKEKALKAYQTNVKQAIENNIENIWVTESKKRMEALTIELGLDSSDIGHRSGS
ncbi:MAG: tetratricopeptide repeat protein [bacterium]